MNPAGAMATGTLAGGDAPPRVGPVRIIAWGNIGRGDDGAALGLLNRLAAARPGNDVELIACHQLGPELAETIADSRLVIFIDADVSPENSGLVVSEVRADPGCPLDSHHVAPPALLALTQALGHAPPAARLIAIRAHELDYGDTLSPRTQAAVAEAELVVRRLARETAACDVSMSFTVRPASLPPGPAR